MKFPLPVVLATGNADKAREIVEILVERADEPIVAWAVTVGTETFGYLLDRPDAIAETVEETLGSVEGEPARDLADLVEADAEARRLAERTAAAEVSG